jgi:hypothetical protein
MKAFITAFFEGSVPVLPREEKMYYHNSRNTKTNNIYKCNKNKLKTCSISLIIIEMKVIKII